jgi:hypothetical protein
VDELVNVKIKKSQLRQVVSAAFLAVHCGRSSDDVVIDDELNKAFITRCHESLPNSTESDLNWTLLNLRKSSSLGPVATKRQCLTHDAYLHASEVAARQIEDKYGITTDRAFCDRDRRTEFDAIARRFASDAPTYSLRKAALKLRKGRQLRPELIKRVSDWHKDVLTFDVGSLQANPDLIPRKPGIYIFADASGYLYLGEAANLRLRVAKHLDHSDRKALARYLWDQGVKGLSVELHVFDPYSNGRLTSHRRAYEADLIRSRRPRFNIHIAT